MAVQRPPCLPICLTLPDQGSGPDDAHASRPGIYCRLAVCLRADLRRRDRSRPGATGHRPRGGDDRRGTRVRPTDRSHRHRALAGIGGFTRAAARMPRLNRRPADTRKPARKSAPKPKPARHAKPTTKVAARPAKSKPQPKSKPSRTVARRSRDDDDDDDLLERIQQRLPVIGPVLIILGGFVF